MHSRAAAGRGGASAAERGERRLAPAPAGVGEAHDGLRRADRPDTEPAGQPGSDVIDDGQQLGVVVLEWGPGLGQRLRQAADFNVPDSLLAAGSCGQPAPGQPTPILAAVHPGPPGTTLTDP